MTVDPQDGSITLPKSADGYLSFSLYWSEDGKQNSAYYIIKVTGDGSGSGSVDPDPLQPQESGTITLDSGYTYTKTDISLAFVPEGFKYAGLLSTEEAGDTGLDGHEYYRWSWSAIYVKSGDHYEAWLAVDPAAGAGSDMSGDRAMTFPDVLLLAQTRGADLSWDYLKPYRSLMPFSGIYARIYYIAGTNYHFYAGGSHTDKISEARLVHIPTGDSIDIFSESFTDFISKHPLTAAPESAKNMDNMTIVVGGKRYYAAEGHTRYLPYGYTGINWLTAVEAENTNLASARYYVADRREDIYVESTYCSQQTIGGKTAYVTELVYIRFSPDPQPEPELRLDDIINLAKKVSIARSDLSRYPRLDDDTGGGQSYTFQVGGIYTAFIRFGKDGKADIFNLFYNPTWESVDVLTQDVKAFIDRHYVVRIYDSASDKLEVENTPAESFWTENGLTFCFPQIRSGSMFVQTADGSSTPLIKALVNKQILVTDIPRFGFEVQIRGLYEGELTGLIPEEARLAQLKHYYPAIFEVDASRGLTIYVSSFAEGRYTCGLLPADVNNVGISGSGGKGCVDYYDMELVLRYGYSQVPDSSITIRPYYDPLSSYMIPDKNAYEKELRELFNGRFKVGDPMSY